MKLLGQNTGLERLSTLRESFRAEIESDYESRAKDCLTCEARGDCCTDAHFVNVHVSRLEAAAMGKAIKNLSSEMRAKVGKRNKAALASLEKTNDSFSKTYSCPLFEKGTGCLVHETAKPLPCINHACYEREQDLPPSDLLEQAEQKIGRLNDRVYRNNWNWLSIPEWLDKVL